MSQYTIYYLTKLNSYIKLFKTTYLYVNFGIGVSLITYIGNGSS